MKKITMEEAVEMMLKANRESIKPLPEEDFKETIRGLCIPMMKQGLIDDVIPDQAYELGTKCCFEGCHKTATSVVTSSDHHEYRVCAVHASLFGRPVTGLV